MLFFISIIIGYKKDTWFSLDTETGVKHDLDVFGTNDNVCPQSTQASVFIGKTGNHVCVSACRPITTYLSLFHTTLIFLHLSLIIKRLVRWQQVNSCAVR